VPSTHIHGYPLLHKAASMDVCGRHLPTLTIPLYCAGENHRRVQRGTWQCPGCRPGGTLPAHRGARAPPQCCSVPLSPAAAATTWRMHDAAGLGQFTGPGPLHPCYHQCSMLPEESAYVQIHQHSLRHTRPALCTANLPAPWPAGHACAPVAGRSDGHVPRQRTSSGYSGHARATRLLS
jgi:hypothetical protein